MADANFTAVPMAASGFGKRSAPDQAPRSRDDFAQLPAREAYIASHIDRLPDGAAVDIKTLAKQIPAYGQQAVQTALNNLSDAGHLRRIRETVGEGRTQWVTRSYFSRTARDDAWWEAFLEEGEDASAPAPARDAPPRPARPARSAAYEALVRLGRTEPRLGLSAAECSALEELADEWLLRGVTPDDLVRTLAAGLPDVVHHPGAFTRTRLTEKMPPETPSTPEPSSPLPRRRVMECTGCGVPGRPEALPGGLCRGCRGESPRPDGPGPVAVDVRAYVSELRAMARTSR
ncbi:hypothetical protein [Streptomyces sp. NPDC001678]|uniref:hypothetical protein n=1 Tax=Streptomyces sp. NPDC001678 TaxID=3364599 RepID=UPI0036B0FA61